MSAQSWLLFSWDWKAQAPINAIVQAVIERPGWTWIEVDTQSDEYAGVVCPAATSQKEAQAEYESDYRGAESKIKEAK